MNLIARLQIGPLLLAPTTEVQRAQRNALVLLAGAAGSPCTTSRGRAASG
ncbi:MAG: hypothetical protein RL341_1325 [Pseudomonadota bacterium]|jgi:hypothetical protein